MEEKILVKTAKGGAKKYFKKLCIIDLIFSVIVAPILTIILDDGDFGFPICFLIVFAGYFIIGSLIFALVSGNELTVTNMRIYGKVTFGKRVDLPFDSISAVATGSVFNKISVSTSSGRITFFSIPNRIEIYAIINKLLMERQQSKANTASAPITVVQNGGEADELKKYKDLLDSGIITQEEFDAKKKQLLDL